MNTLQFLQRLLPSSGMYCAVGFTDNHPAPRHGFFSTVGDLEKAVLSMDARGINTYYALATFNEKTRKQVNATSIKVIAMDVDCGADKPYASWKEGLKALSDFVSTFKLPRPVIVYSGNGLHVYWVLDQAVSIDDWRPVAEAVKSLALGNGFMIDPAITADSARILRPVGTHNPKTGNEVKVLLDAPDITLDDLRMAMARHVAIAKPQAQSMSQPQRGSLLGDLAVEQNYLPSDSKRIETACNQIEWSIKNQGTLDEPAWYRVIGIAAYCENPEETVIRWSNQHPGFDEEATIRKMQHWKESTTGPTKCEKFIKENPSKCEKCKFKGKLTSPAQLGVTYAEVQSKAIEIDPSVADISLPEQFQRTALGIKLIVDGTPLHVCSFDLYPVGYGRDESLGYEVARFMWDRPHVGWTELKIRQAHLVPGNRDFGSVIADQGIVLSNKFELEGFQMLLRSYMEELKKKRGLSNLYNAMGWKEDYNEFVIGGTIIKRLPDGSVVEDTANLSSSISRSGDELYGKKGSLQEWIKFTKLLDKAKMTPHKFMMGASFGSALLKFTGLKGVVFSFYGNTGGGKTLGLYIQQSIWGNPDTLLFGNKFTQNSFFARLATHGNLPMTIDELTNVDSNQIGDMIYWVTQGRDKTRLTRSAEERTARDWSTFAFLSTNKSWAESLQGNGMVSDAQYARLLEFNIPVNPLFSEASTTGRQFHNFLMSNYGHAGPEFIRRLMEMGTDRIQAMVLHALENFPKKYGISFAGQDRFWEVAIVLSDLGNQLAKDFGLVEYDYEEATRWAIEELTGIKKGAAAIRKSAFDIANEYLGEYFTSSITVMHTKDQEPVRDTTRPYVNEVLIRYDMYRKDYKDKKFDSGTVLIERAHFRKWLSSKGYDWKTFKSELETAGALATPASEKTYFGKNIGLKIPQCYVFGINLCDPHMIGILDDAEHLIADQTLGQLQAV
jgi:hypothetical protein